MDPPRGNMWPQLGVSLEDVAKFERKQLNIISLVFGGAQNLVFYEPFLANEREARSEWEYRARKRHALL